MNEAGVTWLPVTKATFRGHACLLSFADTRLEYHPWKPEAASESLRRRHGRVW